MRTWPMLTRHGIGVHSSFEVAVPCSVGLDVVGGLKSDRILVSAEAVLNLSIISPSCSLPSGSGLRGHPDFFCLSKVQHTPQASTHIDELNIVRISFDLPMPFLAD